MLSYVGPLIQSDNSKSPRLAIVGMDHGDNDSGSFSDRTQSIVDVFIHGGRRFNPHYDGVVRTAAAFLGSFGESCREGCLTSRRCRKADNNDVRDCVLEHIAQPNIVKCVPETTSRTSRATSTMRNNCVPHLLAEWKLYKPSICIFHGKNSKEPFITTLKNQGIQIETIQIETNTKDISFSVPTFGIKMFFFSHPAYGHLDRQWTGDVEPCLAYLRTTGEIV
jgi:uracil-DNA glycosylase